MKKHTIFAAMGCLMLFACNNESETPNNNTLDDNEFVDIDETCERVTARTVSCPDDNGVGMFEMGPAQCKANLGSGCSLPPEELQRAFECFNSDENLCNDTCESFERCTPTLPDADPCPIDTFTVDASGSSLAFTRPEDSMFLLDHIELSARLLNENNEPFGELSIDIKAAEGDVVAGTYQISDPDEGFNQEIQGICNKDSYDCKVRIIIDDDNAPQGQSGPLASATAGRLVIDSVQREGDTLQSISGQLEGVTFDSSFVGFINDNYQRYGACKQSVMGDVSF